MLYIQRKEQVSVAEGCSAIHVAYPEDTNLLLGQTVEKSALQKMEQVFSRLAPRCRAWSA